MDPSSLGPEINPRFQKIDKVVLLTQCSLFSGLSQWELKSISQLMRLVEYRKDETVYREGGEADSFYVIVSGRFEAFVASEEKKKVLAYLRRGDHFGEMSLLTNEPHSATIRALSDSVVLELKKDDFKKTIEHNAVISLELSRRLSSRLKVNDARSRSLFKSDVISIFGTQQHVGRTAFSVNFAASLFGETHQKTVLLAISSSETETPSHFGMSKKIPITEFQNVENYPSDGLSRYLARHPAGFEILNLEYREKDSASENIVTALLNTLAINYRFIIIDLPTGMEEIVFKTISQSDFVFLVTDSNLNSLTEAQEIVRDLEKTLSFPDEKFNLVISEAFFGARATEMFRKELFGRKRCFSLPDTPLFKEHDESLMPFVVDEPDAEYSRVVRHIARYVSNNLIGLVLGSGAALGLAHVGVLKVLEREKIPIDVLAGSSIGAIIGSLYAVGKSSGEIEQTALEINKRLLLWRLMDVSLFPVRGLLHGKEVIRHFNKHLGNKTFEHCRIPLKITGANLSTHQSLVFDSGFISDAVRVSIAIPAIFKPVFIKGDIVVDGGILNPLPIRALHDAGAHKVIAVNVFPTPKDMLERRIMKEEAAEKEKALVERKNILLRGLYRFKKWAGKIFSPNIFDILMNTIQSMEAEIAEIEGESADVLIRPVLPNANWVDFYKPAAFIQRGEEEAMRMLPKIKNLVSQQNI